jgi:S-DNA-T family DNA segregation ATPase FtsK/SpoIIIE
MNRDSFREIIAIGVLSLAAFLAVCLFSHDPLDFLEDRGTAAANAGGQIGANVSHHATLWLGKTGSYGAAVLLAVWGVCLLFRRKIPQWGWKIGGSVLFLLVLACYEVAILDSTEGADSFAGGMYGEYLYSALLENLSSFGTYLVLFSATLVAILLTTDTLLYPALARTHHVLVDHERWDHVTAFFRRRMPRRPAFVDASRLFSRLRRKQAPAKRSKPRRERRVTPAAPETDAVESEVSESRKKSPAKRSRTSAENEPAAASLADAADEAAEAPPARRGRPPAPIAVEDEDEDEDALARDDDEIDDDDEEDVEDEGSESDDDDEFEANGRSTVGASAVGTSGVPALPPVEITIREPVHFTEQAKRKTPLKLPKSTGPYHLPPLDLIDPTPVPVNFLDKSALTKTAAKIESTLQNFKIEAQVVEVQKGPTITQFEISLAAGIKVHKIMNLADDLAMALKAQSIRIVAPIPGKSTVGIEVPNESRSMVGLRELIELMREDPKSYKLPLGLGRDTAGNPMIADLGEMPHLLIAGSTGSGKSVCINSVIISILMTKTPDEVKLILVDPKMVELAQFETIPHLLCPVVTDMKKAPAVLNWLVDKMEERYELLAVAGVRHIASYNELGPEKLRDRLAGKMTDDEIAEVPEKLPFVVVIIDELADLMMTSAKEVEGSITRLSQKSRAVGIHVILATQRPSVDVITGLIKANMPSRISFRVTSRVDSRTILDRNGADKLLGRGDCLYLPPASSDVQRVQGTYLSDHEIRSVVQAASKEAEPQYSPELTKFGIEAAGDGQDQDDLFDQAVQIVLGSQRGSVTLLQRQLQIGYTRASRLMELMHQRGLVGPFQGSKAREVYYTLEEWEKSRARSKLTQDDETE